MAVSQENFKWKCLRFRHSDIKYLAFSAISNDSSCFQVFQCFSCPSLKKRIFESRRGSSYSTVETVWSYSPEMAAMSNFLTLGAMELCEEPFFPKVNVSEIMGKVHQRRLAITTFFCRSAEKFVSVQCLYFCMYSGEAPLV